MIPELSTHRLALRLVSLSDLEFVHGLHSLPETDEFNTLGIPANTAETSGVIEGWVADYSVQPISGYTFVIDSKDTLRSIGLIGIRTGKTKYKTAETWYKLHVAEWGKGYATEALKAVIAFGFRELQLHRIEAGCATANIGSVKVLEKARMTREGMKRGALPLKSGWADNYLYGILADDFQL
jgi:[ribosomal protein S5]-alanine N-acetyltransferase